jgi:hypothetical protein
MAEGKELKREKPDLGGLGLSGHARNVPIITFFAFEQELLGRQYEYTMMANTGEISDAFSVSGQVDAMGSGANFKTGAGKDGSGRMGIFGDASGENLVSSLKSLTTTKSITDPVGTWQMELFPFINVGDYAGATWDNILGDGDWVRIEAMWHTGFTSLVMIGKIDKITVGLSVDGHGTIQSTVVISGRDIGAAAMDTPCYFNPYDTALNSNLHGMLVAQAMTADDMNPGYVVSGPGGIIVPKLLKVGTGTGLGYGLPPKVPKGLFGDEPKKWADVIDWDSFVSEGRGYIYDPQVLKPPQTLSIWQWATTYQNPSLNECWFDVTDDPGDANSNLAFFFRERPFVNGEEGTSSPWFELIPKDVPLVQVKGISVSRGNNRVNHIHIIVQPPNGSQQMSLPLSPPHVNLEDMSVYGMKQLEFQSNFLATTKTGKGGMADWATESQEWIGMVTDWNVLNPFYYSGVITLATGRPDIRVGMKAVITGGPSPLFPLIPSGEKDGLDCGTCMTFYVEAVQHSWDTGISPSGETQLQVTRGYPEDKRVDDLMTMRKKWIAKTEVKTKAALEKLKQPDAKNMDGESDS